MYSIIYRYRKKCNSIINIHKIIFLFFVVKLESRNYLCIKKNAQIKNSCEYISEKSIICTSNKHMFYINCKKKIIKTLNKEH